MKSGIPYVFNHHHPMKLCNDLRRGDCCGRFEALSNGYYCKTCDLFYHRKCGKISKTIEHSSHPDHTLWWKSTISRTTRWCNLCGSVVYCSFYECGICEFNIDLSCAMYPPLDIIDGCEAHPHKLTLLKEQTEFLCAANCAESTGFGFPYKCYKCDLAFHVQCVWNPSKDIYPSEVNYFYHSLHPLKLMRGQPPAYSDGKCHLCGRKIIDKFFYHCSSCNFTLDVQCVSNIPPQYLMDSKTHNHQLTLLPRLINFACNVCGLMGDRSPYICIQCDFVIHQDCVGLPRVININRHDHRISRISQLGVVNSICGVCRKRLDWTCGGYSCQKCHGYVVHSKCATRKDVWNGKELEGEPEEAEDIDPYVEIDGNTIQHFSHKEHHLRLNVNDLLWDNNKRCNACIQPVSLQAFYGCMDCEFTLHQNCAKFSIRIRHVLHNERLVLVTSVDNYFQCDGCNRMSNGFMYNDVHKKLDVQCGSISEPLVHPSHQHPLFYNLPNYQDEISNGCNYKRERYLLRCVEDGCGYLLCFKCATLPQVVKHRVDDHPLSLCYGEKADGKYWCDICERETDPETWFYTCKDHGTTLHVECVVGNFSGLMPRSTIKYGNSYEVVLNNSMSRPFCDKCKVFCILPIILKVLGTSDAYICSYYCMLLYGRIF